MSDQTVSLPEEVQLASKLKLGRIVVWIVVGLILIFLALGLMKAFESQPTDGRAPDFTLETYDGQSITLSEQLGKVVVINFWASWCVPCAQEAPALEQAWQTYRDQDVLFLGVGYVDSEEKALAFIQKYGVSYPNGADLRSRISDAYNITGVPETFIVAPDGRITFFAQRPLSFEELSAEIEAARASVEAVEVN